MASTVSAARAKRAVDHSIQQYYGAQQSQRLVGPREDRCSSEKTLKMKPFCLGSTEGEATTSEMIKNVKEIA